MDTNNQVIDFHFHPELRNGGLERMYLTFVVRNKYLMLVGYSRLSEISGRALYGQGIFRREKPINFQRDLSMYEGTI